ncbi:MAG: zf-HC2 domain-containing protein [Verrucomicrobia bacterium]|nr:zf-HC2 domain-containing protein [Verrucomicrobiota bacterium]
MNCRRFQNWFYEYVEGSLSARRRAAAEKHLAQCGACRQAVRDEQQMARRLSDRFRQHTEFLALDPEVPRRVAKALEGRPAPQTLGQAAASLWRRFAWPLAVAASLLVVAGFLLALFLRENTSSTDTAGLTGGRSHASILIQVSYRMPAYQFRQEGNLVIDALGWQTNAVDVSL